MAERKDSEYLHTEEMSEEWSDNVGGKIRQLCAQCNKAEKLKTAKVYCKTCKEYQCSDCTEVHGTCSYMSGHNVVEADHQSAGKADYDMNGMDRCYKHNKRLNFYCKTENKMCCSTCAISSHRKCDEVGEIEQFTNSNDTNITDVKKVLESQIRSASLFLDNVPVVLKETKEDIKSSISKIEQMKEEVIKQFDEFKEKFIAETRLAENGISMDVNINTNKCQHVLDDLNEGLHTLNEVVENGTPTQVFIALHVIKDTLETSGLDIVDCHANLSKLDVSLGFNKLIESLTCGNGEIGSWTIKDVPASTNVDLNCDPWQFKYIPAQLKLRAFMNLKKANGDESEPFYSGIDFLMDGRVVAADNKNKRCVVMNQDLVELGRCTLERSVYDVCAVSDEKVAVSSGDKIYIIAISKNNDPQLVNTLNTKVSYFSIASQCEDKLVAGSYNYGRPARIVTLSGAESDFDVTFLDKIYKLDETKCTYIRKYDTLVVTDANNHTCYLYNINNNTRVDVQDERIKKPRGVCASSSGIVFVICSNDSIVQLSPDGKILGSFTLDLKYPYSVAVSKCDTKLVVFYNTLNAYKLQIFDVD